jgi:hypothetical protein
MKRFQLLVLAVCIAGVSPFAFSSAVTAQARQCSTERPPNARGHWSYRLLDGRKCWYEGQPMLSKSLLQWPPAQMVDHPEREPSFPPTNSYNFLDAQASIPDNSDSFEARWRERFLEAIGK